MGWLFSLISNIFQIISQALKPVSIVAADVFGTLSNIINVIKPFVS